MSNMKTVKDYYQNMIFKLVRDLEIFKSDEIKDKYFTTLN